MTPAASLHRPDIPVRRSFAHQTVKPSVIIDTAESADLPLPSVVGQTEQRRTRRILRYPCRALRISSPREARSVQYRGSEDRFLWRRTDGLQGNSPGRTVVNTVGCEIRWSPASSPDTACDVAKATDYRLLQARPWSAPPLSPPVRLKRSLSPKSIGVAQGRHGRSP